jgi:hypothetical protein
VLLQQFLLFRRVLLGKLERAEPVRDEQWGFVVRGHAADLGASCKTKLEPLARAPRARTSLERSF